MKINEIVSNTTQKTVVTQPSVVKQQARVAKVVSDIAANDTKQAPTEMDKVLAMRSYANMKKRTDKNYTARLQQQLSIAKGAAR